MKKLLVFLSAWLLLSVTTMSVLAQEVREFTYVQYPPPSGEFVVETDTLTPSVSTVKPGETSVTVFIAKLSTSIERQKLESFGLTFTGSNVRALKKTASTTSTPVP